MKPPLSNPKAIQNQKHSKPPTTKAPSTQPSSLWVPIRHRHLHQAGAVQHRPHAPRLLPPDVVQHQALARVEAQPHVPLLPLDLAGRWRGVGGEGGVSAVSVAGASAAKAAAAAAAVSHFHPGLCHPHPIPSPKARHPPDQNKTDPRSPRKRK